MKELLEARKKAIEEENARLNEEVKKLTEQGAIINRRLAQLRETFNQQQGAYVEVNKLLEKYNDPKIIDIGSKREIKA